MKVAKDKEQRPEIIHAPLPSRIQAIVIGDQQIVNEGKPGAED
ncbi:MAG: hypothetical protein QM227_01485 [Bacillota bacterium]|nr:hypothetical protein [Bacillota bacterium]